MKIPTKKRGRPRTFDKNAAVLCAIELFLEKGFEGTSLDDITERLGVNRPSLYAAFGNKEELFVHALEVYHSRYRDYFASLCTKELPVEETIEVWLSWFLENFRAQCDPFGCLIVNSTTLSHTRYPRIAACLKGFHDQNEALLTAFFKERMQRGELPEHCNIYTLSRFYNGVVQGMAVLRRGQGDLQALEAIAQSAHAAWPALIAMK